MRSTIILGWLVLILGVVIYFYIRSRRPSSRFWRAAAKYPEAAYQTFVAEDCWHVVADAQDSGVPAGDWAGPFRLYVPSLDRMIRVYGRYPEFERSQKTFIAKARDAAIALSS